MSTTSFTRALCSILCLLASARVLAVCTTPIEFRPLHYRVGADTQYCQYNDVQSAINAVGECPTIIDVTREHIYNNQHLSIDNKPNLTLQGWGDGVTCAQIPGSLSFPPYSPPDSVVPLVALSGSSDGLGTVLTITGNSHVALRNLTITGGLADSSLPGGGINFSGQGALTLTNTTVNLNHAGFGAGINVNGSDGPTVLTLGAYSQILANTADVSGGGIRLQGNTRMYALQPQTLIGLNHAPNGYGGGIEVLGPARADIGSPGFNGLGVIYDNDAQYGGGMDILTFEDDADAIVRVFTTDAIHPVQISGNFASHTGGAVYLRPLKDIASRAAAVLCAYDFRIEDNAAPEGAAIYADADYSVDDAYGGSIALNMSPFFDLAYQPCVKSEPPTALGARACAASVQCNRFVDNKAEDGAGDPTDGSTILLQNAATLFADRLIARQNTGAHLLRELGDASSDASYAALSNCLFVANTFTQELIAQTDGDAASLYMNSCTIADNAIGAPHAFLAPGIIVLLYDIIDQPGRTTVDPPITDPDHATYLLTNDRSTLPDTVYIHEGIPTFVDAANGDYHLTSNSLGVDSAPPDANTGAPRADLDRKPRVVDLPEVPNNFGPMDLGAYEIQPPCSAADTVYCDGFDGT